MNKHSRVWSLQDAKAKFSEVVRRAQTEGPQIVTVHGKEVVQITAVTQTQQQSESHEDVDRMITLLQSCPVADFEIPRIRTRGRFRDIKL